MTSYLEGTELLLFADDSFGMQNLIAIHSDGRSGLPMSRINNNSEEYGQTV
jgi:hypothetical protein